MNRYVKREDIRKKMPMTYEGTVLEDFGKRNTALSLIVQEYDRAIRMHKPFHSAHEGYAIILEEVKELEAEVFKKQSKRNMKKMKKEAVQVATMALRFIVDVCMKDSMERGAESREQKLSALRPTLSAKRRRHNGKRKATNYKGE